MKRILNSTAKLFLSTLLCIGFAVSSSNAQTTGDMLQGSAVIPTTDTGFISKNIMDNMMEIEMSTLGRKNGSSAAVKKLSNTMIQDHTIILSALKLSARKKHMTLPGHDMSNMAMSSPAPDLSSLTGAAFDKAWITQMLLMHNNKVTELKTTINGTNFGADVKLLARTALARIQVHQRTLAALSTTNP